MKEKTKQILRYVACGLGGLALGIGLLGGLSMCATSGKKTTESVNTILSKPKGEQINTGSTGGNYTGYSFTIESLRDTLAETAPCYKYRIYDVDPSTYTLTRWQRATNPVTIGAGWSNITSAISTCWDIAEPTTTRGMTFLIIEGFSKLFSSSSTNSNWYYYSFKTHETGAYCETFVETSNTPLYAFKTNSFNYAWDGVRRNPIITTAQQTLFYPAQGATGDYVFQDVRSYYKTIGYGDGHTEGYSEGYDDAYAEKDSGIAFTSCGVYPNAHVTLATDETIGNFKYMYLCHYITKPGYDEHTIYIMWTTNANTGQYLGEVIDRNDSDSYDPAVTLGSFTQQATSSVTITATEDMEFGLWVGYITTFHNRGEITNSILWFQGGTSESDMQIYQNGYDEGYQNGNQQGQETGYEEGYDRGHEVGDAEGYSRGYTEGFNQTNTKNVFSLFTSAFDSVASFFDLKIFGFLPLYWFFLAPLFIALISLLMRMVKH